MRRVLKPGGRIALMTSVRREVTLRPLKPVLERASGMRIFEGDEIVEALEQRGFTGIHRRLSGLVQFVGGAARGITPTAARLRLRGRVNRDFVATANAATSFTSLTGTGRS